MAKRSPETITEEEKKKRSERARKAAQAPRRMTEAARKQRSEAGKKGHGPEKAEQIAAAKALLKEEAERLALPAYTRSDIAAARLAAYICNMRRKETPLTETGLIVALGVSSDVFKAYANGERNHLQQINATGREDNTKIDIEIQQALSDPEIKAVFDYLYSDENNDISAPYLSDVIQKARLLVTLEREERLAKYGRVGEIFTMKAREHWQDGTEHKTNVLQITTRNATEALQLLGFKQDTKEQV